MIEWFRHDTDARNDIKIRRLLRDNDRASLGAYWMCVEIIYQNEGYADEAAVTEELSFYNMDEFIPAMIDLDLIERTGDGRLTSKRVLSEIAYWEQTRRKKVEAGRKGGLATQAKATIAKQNSSSAKAVLEDTKAPSSTRQDKTQQDNNIALCSTNVTHNAHSPSDEGESAESTRKAMDFSKIVNLYNQICKSFPSVKSVTEARKKAIRARFSAGFTEDDFRTMFEKAEGSRFLKGGNDRNWTADFDWMLKDSNMAKILEGKYDNRPGQRVRKGNGNGFVPRDINGQYDDDVMEEVSEL